MKTSVILALIIMGGLLILAPVYFAERQKVRIAAFYEKNGNAAGLPREMGQHGVYDWVCLAAGAMLAFTGVRQAIRSREKPLE